ncbi:MAG: hypothetical protein ABGZ35_17320 [Planctomycetaceae bacterium]|jgi:hypothetical protein
MTFRDSPESFEDLAASRRGWIESVLRPWCQQASLKQLRQADMEWHEFAGRVDAHATLWTWAWERYPALVHDDLAGVNETNEVSVTLQDGRIATGFPDGRQSLKGQLVLATTVGQEEDSGPFSIDEIVDVRLV